MAEFPPDLICEILRQLPVTSLLRFKCVSKSFHRIIESRGFMDLHLNTTLEHKTDQKLVFQKNPQLVPIHVLDFDDPFPPLPDSLLKSPPPETDNASDTGDSTDDRISMSGRFSDADKDLVSEDGNNQTFKLYSRRFYGHCNGLVLMVEECREGGKFNTRLGAWNPFTRKHWTLQNHRDARVVDCSFGYDPLTDDYKVLLVNEIHVCWDCYCCYDVHHKLWILGLRSGCWKKVANHKRRRNHDWLTRDVCFVDGAFYYFLLYESLLIYAINVSDEVLSLVSLPNDINEDTHYVQGLQVLEGSICVRFGRWSRDGNDKEEEEEFYVRRKNEDGEIFWMRLLSIRYEKHRHYRNGIEGGKLGYSKRRDKWFILHIGFEYKLYLYDFEEKSIKRVRNGDMKHRVQVISCVESLASLDDYLVRKEEEQDEDNDESKSGNRFSFGEFVQFCK